MIKIITLLFLSISIASAAYNVTLAKEFVYASALIKCNPQNILSWSCGQACHNLTGYKPYYSQEFNVSYNESFAVAMIYNPSIKRFITTYRGTVGRVQLIYELIEGGPVPYELSDIPGAQVNDYFYNHYIKYLRLDVISQLRRAAQAFPDYQFVFTGHSLGAALTTHTALDAVSQGLIKKEQTIMYNFGSPRVGNYIFAEAVSNSISEIYRLTHWRDIVPHVPPCYPDAKGNCMIDSDRLEKPMPGVWPAYHVSQEIFYNENNSQMIECDGGEDPRCSNQFNILQTNKIYHSYYLNVSIRCSPNPKIGHHDSNDDQVFLGKKESIII